MEVDVWSGGTIMRTCFAYAGLRYADKTREKARQKQLLKQQEENKQVERCQVTRVCVFRRARVVVGRRNM